MTFWQMIGWAGTVTVLVFYAAGTARDSQHLTNIGNMIGFVPIAVSAVVVGAWPQATLTVFFGLIGTVGVFRWRRLRQRTTPTEDIAA